MSRKNAKSDQSAELFVKAKLFPIIVIVEFIALVLSFNHNILSLKQSFYNNPYLVLTIVFVSASTFLYYSRLRKKIVKIFLFIAFCLIFAGSVCYHIWGGPSPAPKPDPWRPSHLWHLGSLLLLVLLLMVPIARADTKDVFKIAGFYIDDKRCSYYEDFEEGCVDSQKYRTFRYNQDVRYAFDRGECNGVTGNQPITNLIPLLKKRVERLGRRDLEEYFNTQEKFSRLMTQKGDLFKKIMFTDDEIDRMKSDDVISYGIIKEWLVSCVGVIQPVLTFNIQNTTNQDILITRIVYDVSAVCEIKGGPSGPSYSLETYNHVLKHSIGQQSFSLNPSFKIVKGDISPFSVRLCPQEDEHGLGWVMKIKVYEANGTFQTTEPFQVIMNK